MLFTVMTNQVETVVTNGRVCGRSRKPVTEEFDLHKSASIALLTAYMRINEHLDFPVPDLAVFYLINVNEAKFVETIAQACLNTQRDLGYWREIDFSLINYSTTYAGHMEDLSRINGLPMPEQSKGM